MGQLNSGSTCDHFIHKRYLLSFRLLRDNFISLFVSLCLSTSHHYHDNLSFTHSQIKMLASICKDVSIPYMSPLKDSSTNARIMRSELWAPLKIFFVSTLFLADLVPFPHAPMFFYLFIWSLTGHDVYVIALVRTSVIWIGKSACFNKIGREEIWYDRRSLKVRIRQKWREFLGESDVDSASH